MLSGGLDSALAALHVQRLGVRLVGVTFTSIFTLRGVLSAPLAAAGQATWMGRRPWKNSGQ